MSYKILIIDDEDELLNSMSYILSKYDGHILYVSSGKKAIEVLKTHQIGLVISDFHMREGNGDLVLEFVKKHQLPLDFYFFTATNIEKFSKDIKGHFLKPTDFVLVIETIREYFKKNGHPDRSFGKVARL
jgi:DNA-binding NtrC family response regulator